MNFRTAFYICIIYFLTPSGVFTSQLNPRKIQEVKCTRSDVGEQLILTPLLEQGKIEEARTAATVKLSGKAEINLKGVSIGNGYISPELQTGFAEYVYQLGLLDKNASDVVRKYEDEAVEYISKGDYLRSADMRGMALDIIVNISKVSPYNYLEEATDSSDDLTLKFLNRSEIRRAIHVGNTTFGSDKAIDYLNEDIQQSVVPWFIEVANNYRVLLYTGQLDIILAYPLTLNFLKNVEFNDIQEYRKAERKTWYVGDDVAGYSKSGGKFTEVLVRKAGHIVTVDQPKWAEDLTNRFTRNKPIY
nr:unnamed protein product [Callosobruchus chinensis]